jgi:hypothetical protein
LLFNVFVTCFYSIGVMATVLAASIDHSVAGTAILLSGIVNGIATMLLFIVVDPPGAVIVEQCIEGKRPVSHAKTLNLSLVITRLLGTLLALVLLPWMAQYVLVSAHWVDRVFAAEGPPDAARAPGANASTNVTLGHASGATGSLTYEFVASQQDDAVMHLLLQFNNGSNIPVTLQYASALTHNFILRQGGKELWRSDAAARSAQVVSEITLGAHQTQRFEAVVPSEVLQALPAGSLLEAEAVHNTLPAARFVIPLSVPEKAQP